MISKIHHLENHDVHCTAVSTNKSISMQFYQLNASLNSPYNAGVIINTLPRSSPVSNWPSNHIFSRHVAFK
jgi:hypothetical protein